MSWGEAPGGATPARHACPEMGRASANCAWAGLRHFRTRPCASASGTPPATKVVATQVVVMAFGVVEVEEEEEEGNACRFASSTPDACQKNASQHGWSARIGRSGNPHARGPARARRTSARPPPSTWGARRPDMRASARQAPSPGCPAIARATCAGRPSKRRSRKASGKE